MLLFISATHEKCPFLQLFLQNITKQVNWLEHFPLATVMIDHQSYSLKPHQFIVPWSWRPEAWHLDIRPFILPPEATTEAPSLLGPFSDGQWHCVAYGHIFLCSFLYHLLCVPDLSQPVLERCWWWHLETAILRQDNPLTTHFELYDISMTLLSSKLTSRFFPR